MRAVRIGVAVAGLFAAGSSLGASAGAPTGVVVVTENAGLADDEAKAAVAAAIEAFSGAVELGPRPELASAVLKSQGSDPLKCGADARCISRLGVAVAARYVLALRLAHVAGTWPTSVTLVDSSNESLVARQAVVAQEQPVWTDVMRELVSAVIPDGMRGHSARLMVASDQDGSTVFVDGDMVGTTPLSRPLPVSFGTHRIVVMKDGYLNHEESVDIEPLGAATVEAVMRKIPPPPPPPPPRPLRWGWLGGVAATAVGAGLSAYFGVRMNEAFGSFQSVCEQVAVDPKPCSEGGNIFLKPEAQDRRGELEGLRETHAGARTAWLAVLIPTIAVGAATVAVLVLDIRNPPKPAGVALAPNGVVVYGRF